MGRLSLADMLFGQFYSRRDTLGAAWLFPQHTAQPVRTATDITSQKEDQH